ncbi:predicted protein [Botrytis cinerea T4]|uniref:Uncharacterized protein n=1 Tax=Botryotinia fuckeliana (strain T4) TaxID=999810 RepID=G2XTB4_BOTF4|nr:predicted protein [Botrytis cinerea T4]
MQVTYRKVAIRKASGTKEDKGRRNLLCEEEGREKAVRLHQHKVRFSAPSMVHHKTWVSWASIPMAPT